MIKPFGMSDEQVKLSDEILEKHPNIGSLVLECVFNGIDPNYFDNILEYPPQEVCKNEQHTK